jgi:RNA polymerase sigma-70 factor (ECF subfamily)
MNKTLTAEQSAFASENHHVLMNYLKSKRLKADEYYDILVFGYLEAVCTYLERPDLRGQYTFEAIARQTMNFDLIDYYRSKYRKKNSHKYNVSLNSAVSYGEYDISPEETIAASVDVANEAETKFLWDEISAKLPRRQLNIIRMRVEGYNDREIAKHNGIPFDEFDGVLSGILNSLTDLCCV